LITWIFALAAAHLNLPFGVEIKLDVASVVLIFNYQLSSLSCFFYTYDGRSHSAAKNRFACPNLS
jgi:hypothetical protein